MLVTPGPRPTSSGRGPAPLLVTAYLAAIVAANVTVATFGPDVLVLVALLWIGLDLTVRDALHDCWRGRGLWPRMLALIATGGILSWLVNRDAGWIAVASCAAFLTAGVTDALIYRLLGERSRRLRVNGSNVVSAAVDSLVFPTLAFGVVLPAIVLGQWLAKVLGGALWFEVLRALSVRQRPRRLRGSGHADT